jgi:DHA2 family multidrug resistance protein-like MFS transporter
MDDSIPPGLPLEAAEAARGTLGGAVAVAEQLPDALGIELLAAARDAFSQSLELTAIVSAGLSLLTALLVTVVLRGVERGGGGEAPEVVRAADGLTRTVAQIDASLTEASREV